MDVKQGREKAGPWPFRTALPPSFERKRKGKGIPRSRGPLRGTLFSPFAAIRPHEREGAARVGRDKKAGEKKA